MKDFFKLRIAIIILVFSGIFLPVFSSFGYTGPGSQQDPFYFQEIRDPFSDQMKENTQLESQLKGQYGSSRYYSCQKSTSSCSGDISNPYTYYSCLLMTRYCLETCQSGGYTKYNGSCVSFDESCRLQYGNFVKSDSANGYVNHCSCISGYQWNKQQTQCIFQASNCVGGAVWSDQLQKCVFLSNLTPTPIPTPTPTPTHSPIESSGLTRVPVQCKDGYVIYNNSCITLNQQCRLAYGNFSESSGLAEGVNRCSCIKGSDWNDQQKKCLAKNSQDIAIPSLSGEPLSQFKRSDQSILGNLENQSLLENQGSLEGLGKPVDWTVANDGKIIKVSNADGQLNKGSFFLRTINKISQIFKDNIFKKIWNYFIK